MSTSAKYAALGQPDDRTTAEWIADLVKARQEAEAEAERLRATVARVKALFSGGPDTPCWRTWRENPDMPECSAAAIECVAVPLSDLRAVLAGGVAADASTSSDGDAWRDRHGDIWRMGDDGLMHSYETAPFSREHVEKKWGPLVPVEEASR